MKIPAKGAIINNRTTPPSNEKIRLNLLILD